MEQALATLPQTFRADTAPDSGHFVPDPALSRPPRDDGFRMLSPFGMVAAIPSPPAAVTGGGPEQMPAPPRPDAGDTPAPPEAQVLIPRPAMVPAEQLAEARALALAEGRLLGKAEAQAALQADRARVEDLAKALAAGLAQLATPSAATVDALTQSLGAVIARLASLRAGQAIDAAPAAFARRIAHLADRLAQGTRDIAIHLHPDDLRALQPVLAGICPSDLASLAEARLVADANLMRGDADLRAPGLRLADLLDDPEGQGAVGEITP